MEPKTSYVIEGEVFDVPVKRSSRGAQVYTNAAKSKYLRIGEPAIVEKELVFHKKLLELGWPVAPILHEGTQEGLAYFVEQSLGEEVLGRIFKREYDESGELPPQSFTRFMEVVRGVHDAQEKEAAGTVDFANMSRALHFEELKEELPAHAEKLQAMWDKATEALGHVPACLTHGDFSAHNMLMGGLIDFGDHFRGPVGFDLATAITAPYWFEKDKGAKYARGYDFTDTQIDQYFETVGTTVTREGTVDLKEKFDALFLLRAIWWTVANHFNPSLQQYRYEKFLDLVARYKKGQSLYDHWRETRTR